MFKTLSARPARSAFILAFVALTGTACRDTDVTGLGPGTGSPAPSSPMDPTPAPIDGPNTSMSRVRNRTPFIASLTLASPYVSVNTGYTPITVTVTNPTDQQYGMIYLKGEIQAGRNKPAPVTAFLAYCPNPNGIVYVGNCTMTNGITGEPSFPLGPATYTLKLQQQQPNGTMKVLDSRTVDVVLVRTVEIPR